MAEEARIGRTRLQKETSENSFAFLSNTCGKKMLESQLRDEEKKLKEALKKNEDDVQSVWDKGTTDEHALAVDVLGLEDETVDWRALLPVFLKQSRRVWRARLRHVIQDETAATVAEELQSLIFSRVFLETTLQHIQRALSDLQSFNPSDSNSFVKIGTTLRSQRVEMEALLAMPAILVFEYAANLRLREDQALDMMRLLQEPSREEERGPSTSAETPQGSSKPPDPVPMIIQRLMGGGKTFVLGTLLATCKADGYHLSVLVTPQALYEMNAQDMAGRTWSFFGQRAHFLNYERESAERTDIARLRYVRRELERAVNQRHYIVIPPATAHTVQNIFVELLHELAHFKQAPSKALSEEQSGEESEEEKLRIEALQHRRDVLIELASILRLFRQRGSGVFDEIDVTFDPKTEHNFPLSHKSKPQTEMLDLITHLYTLAGTDGNIKSLIGVRRRSQVENFELHFQDKVQPALIRAAADFIVSDSKWKARVCLGVRREQDDCLKMVLEFLSTPQEQKEKDSKEGKRQREIAMGLEEEAGGSEGLELLALAHMQIWTMFKGTWTKSVNLHYGRSKARPNFPLPVPYSAANTPNESFEFANRWEVLNRACMTYLVTGLSAEQTHQWVIESQKQLMREEEQATEGKTIAPVEYAQIRKDLPAQ
eukprot:Cvel_6929.t1-p1 / transcript=Cvel_6929.t1 / gene=Cvel_6929 / organism=Chromera_velia_CCMP2878 / gene_product=hypothetical protein / transcript_product=hypothetical protein / location=Cvel_scaffold350:92145-96797(+) / protein_length=655 / sequence_SO=supercontig / SO=protein_coding / is_pseudo=false